MSSLDPLPDALTAPQEAPPLGTRFQLGAQLNEAQRAHLRCYGFLHFKGVLSAEEVQLVRDEQDRLQRRWLDEGDRSIYGIPLFGGRGPDGQQLLYRIPFASLFSEPLRALLDDPRFHPLMGLIGDDARVGHDEQDGVVLNRYIRCEGGRRALGWHTDGLRDLFYLRRPQEMLNFGLHLDRINVADGGLRLIPGTHRQGLLSMMFRKPYFISHRPDKREIAVETEPGDMTVHDGRLWHRVAMNPRSGVERRSLYVPYQTGPKLQKGRESKPPLYHRLAAWARRRSGGF